MLRPDGFVQMRVADGKSARGQRVLVFRGQDAAAQWHHFVAVRVPELQALGWQSQIDANFGPHLAENVGNLDVQVEDAEKGSFSLEFGIEIDGVRHPLLPILEHLLARGGIDAAQIVGDELITSLEDGRVLKLPAERIRRLLAVMGDLIEAAGRTAEKALVLPVGAAADGAGAGGRADHQLAERRRDRGLCRALPRRAGDHPGRPAGHLQGRAAALPAARRGLAAASARATAWAASWPMTWAWAKPRRPSRISPSNTPQGRLTGPALIVVPTSLVANWTAELAQIRAASASGGAARAGPPRAARAAGRRATS